MTARRTVTGALLAAALLAGTVGAAVAQDPTPAPGPTQAATVSPPSQQQIDDARNALERLRQPAKTPTTLTQVARPVRTKSSPARWQVSDQAWWVLGAGLLVLLVLSEATRISVRRAKHRRAA